MGCSGDIIDNSKEKKMKLEKNISLEIQEERKNKEKKFENGLENTENKKELDNKNYKDNKIKKEDTKLKNELNETKMKKEENFENKAKKEDENREKDKDKIEKGLNDIKQEKEIRKQNELKNGNLRKIVNMSSIFSYIYNPVFYILYNDNNKNKGKELYLKDLSKSKCDEKLFESFAINTLREFFNLRPKDTFYAYPIDFVSPLFIPVLKTELVENFEILINDEVYKNNTFLNDLLQVFNIINKSNLKYPKINISLTFNYLSLLKQLEINYDKIEKLKVQIPFIINLPGQPVSDPNEHLKYIFSFIKEKQNLKQFELMAFNPLKNESFDILNDFPNLKNLFIMGCQFEKVFTLKLNNLEEISFMNCKNIAFDENKVFKLKKLSLFMTEIIKPKSVITLPEIKVLNFDKDSDINSYINCPKKIDITCTLTELIKINISTLVNLTILETNESSVQIEKEVIEKILKCQNLKVLELKTNLNDEQIAAIKKVNYSVTKIKFQNVDKILNNFLNKFANLTEFEFIYSMNSDEKNIFEIKEDKNSKINKIHLSGAPKGILYCNSFENLNSIMLNFSIGKGIKNIENIFPLFNKNCNIKFKSLNFFHLYYKDMNDSILNTLFNNFEFITNNLDVFTLNITSDNISKKCYYDFIEKSLEKFNKQLFINLTNKGGDQLTEEEIRKIAPKVDISKFDQLTISRY